MKTLNINEIVEKAKEIAKAKDVNLFFFVRGNIIEGCRNRKSSEEYEYDVDNETARFDNTRDEVATEVIEEAIASLRGENETTIEHEEVEESFETSSMSFNPCKSYFLRFTDTEIEDLERGTSMFKTGSMSEAVVLEGLCGFDVEFSCLSKKEIEQKVAQYAKNFSYYSQGCKAVIFEGEFLENNKNSEGVVFSPVCIKGYVKF